MHSPSTSSPISLNGYRKKLHRLHFAVITPSALAYEYTLIDGHLSRLTRSLTPILFERTPADLVTAHATFTHALQDYSAWGVLRDLTYPGWITATIAQAHAAMPTTRLFLIWGIPTFGISELMRLRDS